MTCRGAEDGVPNDGEVGLAGGEGCDDRGKLVEGDGKTDFARSDGVAAKKGVDLAGDKVGALRLDGSKGVFRLDGIGRYGGEAEDPMRLHGLDVGKHARPAAGVKAADGENVGAWLGTTHSQYNF